MTTGVTGNFWNLANKKKPTGELDPTGDLIDVPWDWSLVCADSGTVIATHEMIPTEPVLVDQSAPVDADTKVLARIGVDPLLYDSALHKGQTFGVTCRATFADGQRLDKTLWFKLVEH